MMVNYVFLLVWYGQMIFQIAGLDYADTRISPYEEFQLFKQTDFISSLLRRGERIEYGARTIYEGGFLGVCIR